MRRLGEGGTGAVFLAYHEKENRQVAIKVLAHNLAQKQPSLDRFYREAKSGALLNHPNIVRNIAAGQDKSTGIHYLVLEYVDGPSGLDLLDRYGRLAIPDAIHIILDIARALEHAHSRNVIHRDIKPGNILLTQSGIAKLADMGLAKRTDEASHLTHARQGFGTPYYMPYEQAMNAKYADSRSDIYALGATLYHLVAGEVPFAGVNSLEIVDKKAVGTYTAASQLNPDVPFALDRMLARMMAKEPRDRYQTISELIVDLERSDLAASVPSFIDPQLAMQDPLVRQRLTSPAQTTCPDLRPGEARAAPDAFWFVRLKDRHGQMIKKKLTFEELAQRLRTGKIAAEVEASRTAKGEYRALSSYAEFQEVLVGLGSAKKDDRTEGAEDAPKARESRLALWLTLAAGAAVVVLVLLVLPARGG
jgi:serine/threonine protein kinase